MINHTFFTLLQTDLGVFIYSTFSNRYASYIKIIWTKFLLCKCYIFWNVYVFKYIPYIPTIYDYKTSKYKTDNLLS